MSKLFAIECDIMQCQMAYNDMYYEIYGNPIRTPYLTRKQNAIVHV